ncbi:MAG TPA: PAS domain S-box protein, partial [Tepidiformaceae bacterium]|nr:PAS domain S-box protein [Tepidiformaceae bacterium]
MANDALARAPAALFELTQSVSAARSLDEIHDVALTALQAALGVDRSSVLLFDPDGFLRFKAWRNLSPAYLEAVEGHSPWSPDTRDPQPILVPDVREELSLAPLADAIQAEGIRALAFIPLTATGRLLGKFMLYYPNVHEFSASEVMVARIIAANIALAIDHRQARETRQHLDALFRSRVAGITQTDADGRYLVVNDRYCEITGHSREELLANLDYLSITHLENRPHLAECMALLRSGADDHFTMERRILRSDHALAWVWTSVSALRDDQGRLTGTISVISDITARKLADQLVRESEQRLRNLVEAVDIAVYMTDAEGRITLYNQAAADLWGRSPVIGHDLWCGSWRIYDVDGEAVPLDQCPMARCLKEGAPVRGAEILVERPDGQRLTVAPFPTPLYDSGGAVVGGVNVLVDVSSQKQMHSDLQEALRARDDFLGQVSHELRTPITQIAGNADLLRRRWRDLPPDVQDSSLAEIYSQTIRVQRLIENMMVLSRFERGVVPDTEPHLVQRLIDQTVGEFRARFPDTRLDVRLEPGLPPAETNASTIDQVIWNLLTNAQKYGPTGGPIALEVSSAEGFVEIRVLDEGPGVPEHDLERIFEPYFRSSSNPEHTAGLGLGLSVCKRL